MNRRREWRRFWRRHGRTVLITKAVILIGLLAAYFLPPAHAAVAATLANALWLWKG